MNESSILRELIMDEKGVSPKKPRNAEELMASIVHYGGFLEALTYIQNILRSSAATTLIIRGEIGSGKKSLLKEIFKMTFHNNVKDHGKKKVSNTVKSNVIWLNPFHLPDDYGAMKYLASELGLKVGLHSTGSELVKQIEMHCKKKGSPKLVIVLLEFEEFCRQKQSLLYCLTTLTQHGENVTLIGLTISLDCTKNLEKRVRSRLMTQFYELPFPYRNLDEYLEFSSLLLGGHRIEGRLEERLKLMYKTGNRSIRPLKRFLLTCCSWFDGELTVDEPERGTVNPDGDLYHLQQVLACLTRPQLELLKMAVYHCFRQNGALEFSLQSLAETVKLIPNMKSFDTSSSLVYKNVTLLMKLGLFKPIKLGTMITQNSLFTVGVLPPSFKYVIERTSQYQNMKTDPLWKSL